ncbi:MAG: hypothetical protein MUF31_13100 [Akkermansiaceae bacterium]|jgi:hypothetical protein|nr:hypothetical protein [Akkermansiaceae bacterium]
MNSQALPLLCGAALTLMCGAVASHFAAVEQMVDLATLNRTPPTASESAPTPADPDTRMLIEELQKQNQVLKDMLRARDGAVPNEPDLAAGTNDATLRAFLTELMEQNRGLRDQIAEANRDIMDLQFRTDTFSEQFRPLNATQTDEIFESQGVLDSGNGLTDEQLREDIGVLPPLDVP